ncbi:MAG: hypothetical protein IJ860_00425 [Eubacterium sp.]|nr:hypothetical protein [Eubacterium sp.]
MRRELFRIEYGRSADWAAEQAEFLFLHLYQQEIGAIFPKDSGGIQTLVDFFNGKAELNASAFSWHGKNVSSESVRSLLKEKVMVVGHESNLMEALTLSGNVFGSRLLPFVLRKQEEKAKLAQLFRKFEVEVPVDLPVAALSQLQRFQIEFLKAYIEEKECILFDARRVHLLRRDYAELMRLLRKLCDKGMAGLLVDYNEARLEEYADTVMVLQNSKTVRLMEHKPFNLYRQAQEDSDEAQSAGETAAAKNNNINQNRQEPLLVWENVSGAFLEDVSLKLNAGELVYIVCQSRKESREFVDLLLGQAGFEGSISFDGRQLAGRRFDRTAAVQRGLCVTEAGDDEELIFPKMSVCENICLTRGLRISAIWRRPDYQKHIRETIDRHYGAEGTWRRSMSELTAEERRRAVYLRWMLYRPRLIVLKDPFTATSEEMRTMTEFYISEYLKRDIAVLILTEQIWKPQTEGDATYLLDGTLIRLH